MGSDSAIGCSMPLRLVDKTVFQRPSERRALLGQAANSVDPSNARRSGVCQRTGEAWDVRCWALGVGCSPVFMPLNSSLARQFPAALRLIISPGSHSAQTSKGRQQTSQSVVKRCEAMLVSMTSSQACPQKGQEIVSETSMRGKHGPDSSVGQLHFRCISVPRRSAQRLL